MGLKVPRLHTPSQDPESYLPFPAQPPLKELASKDQLMLAAMALALAGKDQLVPPEVALPLQSRVNHLADYVRVE